MNCVLQLFQIAWFQICLIGGLDGSLRHISILQHENNIQAGSPVNRKLKLVQAVIKTNVIPRWWTTWQQSGNYCWRWGGTCAAQLGDWRGLSVLSARLWLARVRLTLSRQPMGGRGRGPADQSTQTLSRRQTGKSAAIRGANRHHLRSLVSFAHIFSKTLWNEFTTSTEAAILTTNYLNLSWNFTKSRWLQESSLFD